MLSHIPARSFPSLSWTQGEKKKKKKEKRIVWPRSSALCRETPRQSQEEERERRGSDFLPPNRQRLPMKRDAVQLDLWGDVGVILTQASVPE